MLKAHRGRVCGRVGTAGMPMAYAAGALSDLALAEAGGEGGRGSSSAACCCFLAAVAYM